MRLDVPLHAISFEQKAIFRFGPFYRYKRGPPPLPNFLLFPSILVCRIPHTLPSPRLPTRPRTKLRLTGCVLSILRFLRLSKFTHAVTLASRATPNLFPTTIFRPVLILGFRYVARVVISPISQPPIVTSLSIKRWKLGESQ